MISRRAALGTGAAVAGGAVLLGAARVTHRLDDLARAAGIHPKPEPDPEDDRLLRAARRDLEPVVALAEAIAERHPTLDVAPLVAIGREHLRTIGGSTAATDLASLPSSARAAVEALQAAYTQASEAQAVRARRAFSPDLTRVMASMSAGLAQCAHVAGGLR